MIKKYSFLLVVCLLFSLGSCETERAIQIDFPQPLAVMNAVLHPDSVVAVEISASFNSVFQRQDTLPATGKYDVLLLENAQVELSVNGSNKGLMKKGDKKGYYYMPDFYPSEGDRISMQVITGDYPDLKAETLVPDPVRIVSIDTLTVPYPYAYDTKKGLKTSICFEDEPGVKNYYCLRFKTCLYSEDQENQFASQWTTVDTQEEIVLEDAYYPGSDLFRKHTYYYTYEDELWTVFVFDDYLFDGKEYTLNVIISLTKWYYLYPTDLYIDMFTISESTYLHIRSKILQDKQKDVLGNSGLREPIPTYTNVQGGYGLLSALQRSDRYIFRLSE